MLESLNVKLVNFFRLLELMKIIMFSMTYLFFVVVVLICKAKVSIDIFKCAVYKVVVIKQH